MGWQVGVPRRPCRSRRQTVPALGGAASQHAAAVLCAHALQEAVPPLANDQTGLERALGVAQPRQRAVQAATSRACTKDTGQGGSTSCRRRVCVATVVVALAPCSHAKPKQPLPRASRAEF